MCLRNLAKILGPPENKRIQCNAVQQQQQQTTEAAATAPTTTTLRSLKNKQEENDLMYRINEYKRGKANIAVVSFAAAQDRAKLDLCAI